MSSSLLRDAIEGIPVLQDRLGRLLNMFDLHAARAEGKVKLGSGSDPEYDHAFSAKVRGCGLLSTFFFMRIFRPVQEGPKRSSASRR